MSNKNRIIELEEDIRALEKILSYEKFLRKACTSKFQEDQKLLIEELQKRQQSEAWESTAKVLKLFGIEK